MNDEEKKHAQALVTRLLDEAQKHAVDGNYTDALAAVRKARALNQSNLYVLALERQIEQLGELAGAGTLTDEQRQDVLGSLPSLLEQARQSQAEPTDTGAPGSADREIHRRAALLWLKNQYFQRTHEYVRQGKYDDALAELQRVFIVDRQDKFAREFELKILQMQELRRRKPLVATSDPPGAEEIPPTPAPPAQPAKSARPERTSYMLAIALSATVVLILFAFYYFWKRDTAPHEVMPGPEDPATEKVTDEPFYPLPPPPSVDTTKTDSTHAP